MTHNKGHEKRGVFYIMLFGYYSGGYNLKYHYSKRAFGMLPFLAVVAYRGKL